MDIIRLPIRILLVENQPTVRKINARELAKQGYQLYLAQGEADALITDAWRLAKESRCQIAVIDLRLWHDWEEEDWSGFDIVARIKEHAPWVTCILQTSYGTFELATRAQALKLDIKLIDKNEGATALVDQVTQIVAEHLPRYANQSIEGLDILQYQQLLAQLVCYREPETLEAATAESEFLELLCRLFPDSPRLSIRFLQDPAGQRVVAQGHSTVLGIVPWREDYPLREVVLKIAPPAAIDREVSNIRAHVIDQLGGRRNTQFIRTARTWYLAGMVLSLIGAELDQTCSLAEFYADPTHTFNDLTQVLESLFGERGVLEPWYRRTEPSLMPLIESYARFLGLDNERLAVLAWEPTATHALGRPHPELLPPAQWLQKHNAPSHCNSFHHIVHGDLHTRNILVGPHQGVWLLDFERTGDGHALHDFVELETDLKCTCLPLGPNKWEEYAALELALLAQSAESLAAKTLSIPARLRNEPRLERAFQTISRIRHYALPKIGYPDLHDYFWALAMENFYVATLHTERSETRHRALISAYLICDRLSHLASSAPA